MSFGYSIGDFVKTLELAHAAWERFASAPAQYQALSKEVRGLVITIDDVKTLLQQSNVPSNRQKPLADILAGCYDLLLDLNSHMRKFPQLDINFKEPKSAGQRLKIAWKRVRWDPQNVDEWRSRISSNVSFLQSYLSQLNLRMTRDIKDVVDQIRQRQSSRERSAYHEEILNWITRIDSTSDHMDVHSRHTEGTGQWLLETREFKSWQARPGILYCPGLPGAGKTILTSVIVNHLYTMFQENSNTGIAFFYCNFTRQGQQRPIQILSSLLRQLLECKGEILIQLEESYEKHNRHKTHPNISEISELFVATLRLFRRSFVIIDALDEASAQDPTCSELITSLLKIRDQCDTNLLLTSRFVPQMTNYLGSAGAYGTIAIKAHHDDLRQYLRKSMYILPGFVQRNQELQNDIIFEISRSVDEMFLLAKLFLETLRGYWSVKQLRLALLDIRNRSYHRDGDSHLLDFTYSQAMARVKCQTKYQAELANKALFWIVYAFRPLMAGELQCALSVEPGEDYLDFNNIPDLDAITAACAGLVTIDHKSSVIRLVHYTAQDYFHQLWKTHSTIAHSEIAHACMALLQLKNAGVEPLDEMNINAVDHLHQYAVLNWGHHAHLGSGMVELVIDFLSNKNVVRKCWARIFPTVILSEESAEKLGLLSEEEQMSEETLVPQETPILEEFPTLEGQSIIERNTSQRVSAAHLISYFNLYETCDRLMQLGWPLDEKDDHDRTPLSYAAERGFEQMVDFLLEAGANCNSECGYDYCKPLWHAIYQGHTNIVRRFLKEPVDVNHIGGDSSKGYRETSLWLAAHQGSSEDIINLLLGYPGIDVNLTGKNTDEAYETPLVGAVTSGNLEMVKLLLAHPDVDINLAPDPFDFPPIFVAAIWSNTTIFSLLLSRDVSLQYQGTTLLHHLVRHGYGTTTGESVFSNLKILLASPKMNINALDSSGNTALHVAMLEKRPQDTIQMLLSHPKIDVNAKNHAGHYAIHYAIDNEREILKLFLEREDTQLDVMATTVCASLHVPLIEANHDDLHSYLNAERPLILDHFTYCLHLQNERGKDASSSIFHSAAEQGLSDLIELLLALPTREPNTTNSKLQTPLHSTIFALQWHLYNNYQEDDRFCEKVAFGLGDVVALLLEDRRVDVNAKDVDGNTPLMLALKPGGDGEYSDIGLELIEHLVHDERVDRSSTSFEFAVGLLGERGFEVEDLDEKDVNGQDFDGREFRGFEPVTLKTVASERNLVDLLDTQHGVDI
ncbi:hypothetical protein B0J11DRAFT_578054 [Dendryphion nanum]|uniref:NACHT domain-containing protein n=1 Tax=Dendryphion nanum TaxID=256645 RepID=A0A9P9E1H9_9PLEO|nr:hypothetical protein B0J11DRAFT_578054 [Dendryphion nanum]